MAQALLNDFSMFDDVDFGDLVQPDPSGMDSTTGDFSLHVQPFLLDRHGGQLLEQPQPPLMSQLQTVPATSGGHVGFNDPADVFQSHGHLSPLDMHNPTNLLCPGFPAMDSFDDSLFDHSFEFDLNLPACDSMLGLSNIPLAGTQDLSIEEPRAPVMPTASNRKSGRSGRKKGPLDGIVKVQHRRATKLDKLLGGCYQVQSLSLAKPPKKRDQRNDRALRSNHGQCVRCIFYHRKCSLETPCRECSSVTRKTELECVRADYRSFNVFALEPHEISPYFNAEVKPLNASTLSFLMFLCRRNAFLSQKTRLPLTTWRKLWAIGNLTAMDESSVMVVAHHTFSSKPMVSALRLAILSSLLLMNKEYLLALAPDQEPFLRAARAFTCTLMLKTLDALLRGKPSECSLSPRLRLEYIREVSAFLLVALAYMDLKAKPENRHLLESRRFMEGYLSESVWLCKDLQAAADYEKYVNMVGSLKSVRLEKTSPPLNKSQKAKLQRLKRRYPFLGQMPPQKYASIVPIAWWHTAQHPVIPGLTLEDLSLALALSADCNRRFRQESDFGSVCLSNWRAIKTIFPRLAQKMAATIAHVRKREGDKFLAETKLQTLKFMRTAWEKISTSNPEQSSLKKLAMSIDAEESGDPWAHFLVTILACMIPITLGTLGIVESSAAKNALLVMLHHPRYTMAGVFLTCHTSATNLIEKYLSLRTELGITGLPIRVSSSTGPTKSRTT